jgi:hypothetical protein
MVDEDLVRPQPEFDRRLGDLIDGIGRGTSSTVFVLLTRETRSRAFRIRDFRRCFCGESGLLIGLDR